jgi:hypothetical protein
MKRVITLSLAAALCSSLSASTDVEKELETLKKKIKKLEKKLKRTDKKLTEVKIHDAKDNIKWSVDLRTAIDSINVTTASGKKYENNDLMTNRLLLNMAYAPSSNLVFKGSLSYNKAFGANTPNPSSSMGMPQRGYGYDTFDWVINENLIDNSLRVKEAYWLYMNNSFMGNSDIAWTASFGRRPSTDGFLTNLREGNTQPKSPIGHIINVEFDGASFKFNLDKVSGVQGMSWKACLGRGLTNARSRFNMDGGLEAFGDYTADDTTLEDIDMYGFIFVPYNDGQYKVVSKWYRGTNVPGFTMAEGSLNSDFTLSNNSGMVGGLSPNFSSVDGTFQGVSAASMNSDLNMKSLGDMDGSAISLQVSGIGDGISDFLDNTTFFASYAYSKTRPSNAYSVLDLSAFDGFKGYTVDQINGALVNMGMATADLDGSGMIDTEAEQGAFASNMAAAANSMPTVGSGMLGSTESKTGNSIYIGANMPCMITEDGRIGIEYNKGSKYWRSFTYGEDTLAGSKLAARGDAFEVYYTKPLMEGLTAQVRYTRINYDYTGSQGFFGADGMPLSMDEAVAMGMDPVKKATDLRAYIRYNY